MSNATTQSNLNPPVPDKQTLFTACAIVNAPPLLPKPFSLCEPSAKKPCESAGDTPAPASLARAAHSAEPLWDTINTCSNCPMRSERCSALNYY